MVVDVRSPCEFESENIPGAVNIPLLSNDERAHVGTIYATQGEARARRVAVDLISPKIPSIIDKIVAQKAPGRTIVIHCWRGGLRSEAVASFLSIVGIDTLRLTGGYKAWRRSVVASFESDRFQFQTMVLDGLAGAGKTDILKHLKARGISTIDLEELASHRGSVFGGLGLAAQPTQKNFEGRLWMQVKQLESQLVFLEAEGKRIGRLRVPEFLIRRIASSPRVLVTSSLDVRCRRLVNDYCRHLSGDELLNNQAILAPLKERLGKDYVKELSLLLARQDYTEFTSRLLRDYYDPLYSRHMMINPYALEVCGDKPDEAADEVISFIQKDTRMVESMNWQ